MLYIKLYYCNLHWDAWHPMDSGLCPVMSTPLPLVLFLARQSDWEAWGSAAKPRVHSVHCLWSTSQVAMGKMCPYQSDKWVDYGLLMFTWFLPNLWWRWRGKLSKHVKAVCLGVGRFPGFMAFSLRNSRDYVYLAMSTDSADSAACP